MYEKSHGSQKAQNGCARLIYGDVNLRVVEEDPLLHGDTYIPLPSLQTQIL